MEQKTVTTISSPHNLRSSHPQVFLKTVILKNLRELLDQGIFRVAIITFLGVLKSPKELIFFQILQCFHSITSVSLTFKRLTFFHSLIKLVILTFVIKSNAKTSVMLKTSVTTYTPAMTHILVKPIFTKALMIWLTLSEAGVFLMSVFSIMQTV